MHSETNPKSVQKGKPIDDRWQAFQKRSWKSSLASILWWAITIYRIFIYIGQAQMQNQ